MQLAPFLSGTRCYSQVLVVRRSLDVLDVLLLGNRDTTIGQLGVVDLVLAVEAGTGASPVPIKATDVLQTGHLFVGQVREDLDHVATVAVNSEDVFVDKGLPPDSLLEQKRSTEESTNDPFGIHGVFKQKLLHYYFNYKLFNTSVELILQHLKKKDSWGLSPTRTLIAVFKHLYSLIVS